MDGKLYLIIALSNNQERAIISCLFQNHHFYLTWRKLILHVNGDVQEVAAELSLAVLNIVLCVSFSKCGLVPDFAF